MGKGELYRLNNVKKETNALLLVYIIYIQSLIINSSSKLGYSECLQFCCCISPLPPFFCPWCTWHFSVHFYWLIELTMEDKTFIDNLLYFDYA